MNDGEELSIEDFKKITCNPFYAVNFASTLFAEHEPLVSKEDWAKVMVRNITEKDDGTPVDDIKASIEEWMMRLLTVLEGDYV